MTNLMNSAVQIYGDDKVWIRDRFKGTMYQSFVEIYNDTPLVLRVTVCLCCSRLGRQVVNTVYSTVN